MSGLYISDDEAQAPLINNKANTPIAIAKPLDIISYQNDSDIPVMRFNIPSWDSIVNHSDTEQDIYEMSINQNENKNTHCDPPKWRWFVLLILCIQSVCIWYSFDTLTILHNEFFDEFNLKNTEYNLLYSIAVFPSLILSVFASYIIDRYGITYSLLVSLLLTLCGESLFAISCSTLSYKVMLIGRTLYGIGASWNGICSFIIIYHYFIDLEFATSLSILFSCIRLGFIVNDFITMYIMNTYDSISLSIWFGALLIFISFLSTLYMLGAHTSSLYMNSITRTRTNREERHNNRVNRLEMDASHLYSFKIGFWLLSLLCGLGFAFFSTWNSIGVALMHTRYGMSESVADYHLLILYIIPCVLSPLYGVILDKHKSFYCTLLIGGILGIIGHMAMMLRFEFTNEYLLWMNYISRSPTVSLIFIGSGYTLFNSALWPSVPFMIDEQKLGTGYGLMYAFYCICYSVSQILLPMFIKNDSNQDASKYDHVCLYLIALSLMYCLISVILWLWKKDDDYRVIQYKSISSISTLSHILPIAEEENDNENENENDEEGDAVYDEYIGGHTMMGAIDSNVSTVSLFSEEHHKDIDENQDIMCDLNRSETMLGYAGEDEMIDLKTVNPNQAQHNDDNSSISTILTDDENYALL